jgi:hypothetical protein
MRIAVRALHTLPRRLGIQPRVLGGHVPIAGRGRSLPTKHSTHRDQRSGAGRDEGV